MPSNPPRTPNTSTSSFGNPSAPTPAASAPPALRTVSLASFSADVLTPSLKKPVVVVFGAPFGGAPCKTFEDTLNMAVHALRGAVALVRIDAQASMPLAQQLGVQSIPTVLAFFQGQPIDGFEGAAPAEHVKAWLSRLMTQTGAPSQGDEATLDRPQILEDAEACRQDGDYETAEALYHTLLEADPNDVLAHAGLVRCRLEVRDLEGARAYVDGLAAEVAGHKDFAPVRSALDLAEEAHKAAGRNAPDQRAALESTIARNPDDHETRLALAMLYLAEGARDMAVDVLLESIRRNRTWNEEAARKQLLKMFESFGFTDPLAVEGRRRLSSILFS